LFEPFLPGGRGEWISKRLKQIRETAGEARDLDVLFERLTQSPPCGEDLAPLLDDIQRRRAAAQPPIQALHEKLSTDNKLRRRIRTLVRRIRWRGEGAEPRYGPWADEQLRGVLESFFEAASADLSDLEALHQFRIVGKKLRYTMELLAGAYPRGFRKQLYGEIVALQERLGAINDHRVAQARYANWAEQCSDAAYRDLLNRLAHGEESQVECQRAEFTSWWHDEQRDELRRRFDEFLNRSC
jgi:CHAD domain-containing protein